MTTTKLALSCPVATITDATHHYSAVTLALSLWRLNYGDAVAWEPHSPL